MASSSPSRPSVAWMAVIAVGSLLVGSVVYLTDRVPETVYLMPAGWSGAGSMPRFGWLGGVLPDFLHVYAFGLVTAAVLGATARAALYGSVAWCMIDSVFEIGQHEAIGPVVAALLPAWFEAVPVLENAGPYLLRGTFDPWDLFAIALGAVAAYATVRFGVASGAAR